VSHASSSEAFYTTALFKLERFVLRVFLDRAVERPRGGAARARRARRVRRLVGGRPPADQLLLADLAGRTRSWLMVARRRRARHRLYFGSAVVARRSARPGGPHGLGCSAPCSAFTSCIRGAAARARAGCAAAGRAGRATHERDRYRPALRRPPGGPRRPAARRAAVRRLPPLLRPRRRPRPRRRRSCATASRTASR
jgi:hypothetical protein